MFPKWLCSLTNDVSWVSLNLEGSGKAWKDLHYSAPNMELFDDSMGKNPQLCRCTWALSFQSGEITDSTLGINNMHFHTIQELKISHCLPLPLFPSANLHWENSNSLLRIVESLESGLHCEISDSFITFNLPSVMVTALYRTWNTARKKMKMCNWCNALTETIDTYPYNKTTISKDLGESLHI